MDNLTITNLGSNYLAKIVKLKNLRKHNNADKLLCVTILNNNIITGIASKENDLVVYFPLECSINNEYLAFSNSFSDPELNSDKKTKSFFSSNGRVRCIKLRSEKSEGYIVSVASVNNWLGKEIITEADIDKDFDTINGVLLCKKYINRQDIIDSDKAARQNKKGKKAKEHRVIEGQFAFHCGTSHLGREIYDVRPDDLISITYKLHGTSNISSKLLCKRPLKWYESFLKIFLKIQDSHYDYLWASRTVLKSENAEDKVHYYSSDVWKDAFEKLKHSLKDGLTIYSEIVGYTNTGKMIQKNYDYGCLPGTFEIYLYRITYTSMSGDVYEFSWPQIKDYCINYGLKHVPEHYYGKAEDLFPELKTDEHWRMNFLQKLSETYLEKDCYICKNKVPAEGIVLRKESGSYKPYKHKASAFRLYETKQIDTGEVNIEDVS